MSTGRRLQEKIDAESISVCDLADALGYCRQHVSALLHNKRPISTETALRLSVIFKTSIYFWLDPPSGTSRGEKK
jgi:addiction module HigA family antidote